MKKLKTYVLMVAEKFPVYHSRKGEPTGFGLAIKHYDKIHTIRANYELWKKRIDEVNAGRAILELRMWVGKPYQKGSTQACIFRYDKTHGLGVEKVAFYHGELTVPMLPLQNNLLINVMDLAKNDGLHVVDFFDWFKPYDLKQPMAIIHFTNFRYLSSNS
jgi:hypothetical protein